MIKGVVEIEVKKKIFKNLLLGIDMFCYFY